MLTALGQATSRLREKLGESLASIQTLRCAAAARDHPVARSAARLLARARRGPWSSRGWTRFRTCSARSSSIRTSRWRTRSLPAVYANTGRSTEAAPIAQRAFELRDRVSERERYFISWRYYMDTAQAWDKALELSTSWTKTYPREAFAFNSLGLASGSFGQHERAVEAFREAMRLDPRVRSTLRQRRRFADGLQSLRRGGGGARRGGSHTASISSASSARRMCSAFLRNDATAMARELKTRGGHAGAASGARTGPRATRCSPASFTSPTSVSSRAFKRRSAQDFPELAAQWTMEDAEGHAVAGQCEDGAARSVGGARAAPRQLHARARRPNPRALRCRDARDQSSSTSSRAGFRRPR